MLYSIIDQVEERLTVMRRSTDSRKASSSARDFRISASLEMLIRIVKAFFAMGYCREFGGKPTRGG